MNLSLPADEALQHSPVRAFDHPTDGKILNISPYVILLTYVYL